MLTAGPDGRESESSERFKIKLFHIHTLWLATVITTLSFKRKTTAMFSATDPPLPTNTPLGRRENNPLHK